MVSLATTVSPLMFYRNLLTKLLVLNYEVVLSNATIVNANATSNPDLFWALKGGGNQFGGWLLSNIMLQRWFSLGIVTKFTLRTYPIEAVGVLCLVLVTNANITISDLGRHSDLLERLFGPNTHRHPRLHREFPRPKSRHYCDCRIRCGQFGWVLGSLLFLQRADPTDWSVWQILVYSFHDRHNETAKIQRTGTHGHD
jgi:hypothetical protein